MAITSDNFLGAQVPISSLVEALGRRVLPS